MQNFAINNRYLYDRMTFIKKNTVINKIVPDFMDTLYLGQILSTAFDLASNAEGNQDRGSTGTPWVTPFQRV